MRVLLSGAGWLLVVAGACGIIAWCVVRATGKVGEYPLGFGEPELVVGDLPTLHLLLMAFFGGAFLYVSGAALEYFERARPRRGGGQHGGD